MQTNRRLIRQTINQVLESNSVLCAPEIADQMADAILALEPKKKSRPKQDPNLFVVARALSEVCGLDFSANKGQLFHEAKMLILASPPATPELVHRYYGGGDQPSPNWYKDDWRGKQYQYPRPAAIRQTWSFLINIVGKQSAGPLVVK